MVTESTNHIPSANFGFLRHMRTIVKTKSLAAFLAPGLLMVAVWLLTRNISALYLRQEIPVAVLVLALFSFLLSVRQASWRDLTPAVPVAIWVGIGTLSVVWSLSPGASLVAAMWMILYSLAFVIGMQFPRSTVVFVVIANLVILASSVDQLLVSNSDHLVGVWFNKNVQGAQLLLLGPLIAAFVARSSRFAPYAALCLGLVLFASLLTQSVSTQVVLFISTLIAFLLPIRMGHAGDRLRLLISIAAIAGGIGLGWSLIQPQAIQVAGQGMSFSSNVQASEMDKTNTTSSILHRVEMTTYGLKRGLEAFPLGTGVGSVRDLYSGMKRKAGTDVSDIHNYYVQLWLTVGFAGLAVFCIAIVRALRRGWVAKRWGMMIACGAFALYLSFDVAAYFPALMILFLALLGSLSSQPLPHRTSFSTGIRMQSGSALTLSPFRIALVVSALIMASYVWWSQPCDSVDCAISKKLARRDVVIHLSGSLEPSERSRLALAAYEANPESLWSHEFLAYEFPHGDSSAEFLELRQLIAKRFPVASPHIYDEWFAAALRVGDNAQMREAAVASLEWYPRKSSLLSVPYRLESY